jgi:hypothetical protein
MLSCTSASLEDISENDNVINLKWNKSYTDDNIEKATLGLSWCYSNLGAKILNTVVLSNSNKIISVDVNELGFNQNAIENLEILHTEIKNAEEYRQKSYIDLGRYVSLLIGASEHYYAITNVPYDLEEILSNYQLNIDKGYINNSGVSFKHRIIEYSDQTDLKQLFMSTEVDPTSGEILEYETIEIMGNGQLKFGLFDVDGTRKNTGNPEHTRGGKPAKCMWCHESNINRLFSVQNDFSGYLTYPQMNATLTDFNNSLSEKQLLLTDGVNFNNTQQHSEMELIYISFMEPSAERLSLEWDLSITEVQNRLSNLQTHIYLEFPFLGNLYHRNEVESFAPFQSLEVSSSIREASEIEVNHIN